MCTRYTHVPLLDPPLPGSSIVRVQMSTYYMHVPLLGPPVVFILSSSVTMSFTGSTPSVYVVSSVTISSPCAMCSFSFYQGEMNI